VLARAKRSWRHKASNKLHEDQDHPDTDTTQASVRNHGIPITPRCLGLPDRTSNGFSNSDQPQRFFRAISGTAGGARRSQFVIPETAKSVGMRTVEPAALPAGEIGLFLDVDGTLLDLAPRPEAVVVKPGLLADLEAAERLLGGALALVSGRPIETLDQLFAPLLLCAAGVHGAEIRRSPRGPINALAQGRLSDGSWSSLNRLLGEFPGSYAENKGVSFAVHYPDPGTDIHDLKGALSGLMERINGHGDGLRLLAGHAVFEIQLKGFDKGRAIERFMTERPFSDRRPVFVGDDEMDRAGFDAALRLGGLAFSVGIELPGLSGAFSGPDAVRRWLHELGR
jgi:trehalose 6-phosphate phosphatase